jgi:hypothetical protein
MLKMNKLNLLSFTKLFDSLTLEDQKEFLTNVKNPVLTSHKSFELLDMVSLFDKQTPDVVVCEYGNIFVRFIPIQDLEKEFPNMKVKIELFRGIEYYYFSGFKEGTAYSEVYILKNSKSKYFEKFIKE